MNFRKVAYWIATAIVVLAMVGGGAADFLLLDVAKEGMDHLGYPYYFAQILGFWKVLGGIASGLKVDEEFGASGEQTGGRSERTGEAARFGERCWSMVCDTKGFHGVLVRGDCDAVLSGVDSPGCHESRRG